MGTGRPSSSGATGGLNASASAFVFAPRRCLAVADVVVTDVVISIGRRLVLNRKRSVTIRRNARASDVDREARLARS